MANVTVEMEVGDVVSLNSGGPDMTIREIDDDTGTVTAVWFEQSNFGTYFGEPHVAEFVADTLTYEDE